MGNACSSKGDVSPPGRKLSALDILTAEKLKEYIAKNRVEAAKSLNQIVMKFPAILKAFEEIRVIFEQMDADHNGTIEKSEFLAACEKMKVSGVDSETVNKIYDEADIDHDGHVDYKEFILMITLLYVMSDMSVNEDQATLIHNAVQKVLEAFLFFDRDGDGYIEKEEVTEILSEKGQRKSVLSAERFDELDWDHNGRVTFREFLFAVSGWVGLEEDEE